MRPQDVGWLALRAPSDDLVQAASAGAHYRVTSSARERWQLVDGVTQRLICRGPASIDSAVDACIRIGLTDGRRRQWATQVALGIQEHPMRINRRSAAGARVTVAALSLGAVAAPASAHDRHGDARIVPSSDDD